MSFLESIRIAVAALGANKLRSVLTTLGVIIGVGSMIAMVALGEGARRDMEEQIQKLGSNLLIVAPGKAERGHIWRAFGSADTLTVDDAREMRFLPELAGSAPEIGENMQISWGNTNLNAGVTGTTSDYSFVRNVEMAAGRFFTTLEDSGRRRVAVLGAQVAEDLFGSNYPVGKRIKLQNVPFTVVGVRASLGGFGRDDDKVFIPLSVMRQRFAGSRYVRLIGATAREGVTLAEAEQAIRKYLRARHRLRPGQEDDFSMSNQQDILSTREESNRIFTMLLAGIASISLVVGGIGIMNIMLVTVTERTREIGIRKALGARRRDIERQFLIESTLLSGLGGLLGVALGVGVAWLTEARFGISTYVSPESVFLAAGCAAAVGIFFGYWPASQAGRLDPIEALRYE